MDPNFIGFIEIDGQKYKFEITRNVSSVRFEDIFEKIQQIIKIVIKEDIGFATHIFEVFDNNSSEGVVIQGFNTIVKNLSTIRIHRNPVVSPSIFVLPFNPNLPPIGFTALPFVPIIPTLNTSSNKANDDFIPHQNSSSSPNLSKKCKKDGKTFKRLVRKLIEEKEDIKVFHLIVQLVEESQTVHKRKDRKRWECVSYILIKYGYSSTNYSPLNCEDKFFDWSAWYTQNFKKLNGYLEPKEQEVFDLLKIVHILDFDKFWSNNNTTHSLLTKISDKNDIKLYLNDLENRKLVLKRINRKDEKDCHKSDSKSSSKSDTIPEKYLKGVAIHLQNGNKSNEPLIDCKPDVRSYRPPKPSLTAVEKSHTNRKDKKDCHNSPKSSSKSDTITEKDSNSVAIDLQNNNKNNESVIYCYPDVRAKRPAPPSQPSLPSVEKSQTIISSQTERNNILIRKKQSNPKIVNKDFESFVTKLKSNENIIQTFHEMIVEMNIGWNFKDNPSKYWKVLVEKMCRKDSKYSTLSYHLCKTRFYEWTLFYVQNYDKLNGKLEPKLQKIFDCLKIVHTLDLKQLFSSQSLTYIKIKDISLRKDFMDYFNKHLNHIRIKKLATKETEPNEDKSKDWKTTDPNSKQKNIHRIYFIPRAPQPQNKLLIKRDRLSGRSPNQLTDKPTVKKHKKIEVIVLD